MAVFVAVAVPEGSCGYKIGPFCCHGRSGGRKGFRNFL